eukprot:CAMPEP_0183833350 /NCGR_PEP_ID=MMETSP0807_2-20130328/6017_1 /TAXON_ID=88271 /ORGANISM="Picocystis salinarum, Strain CCMP1897" /LENGTH=185 /DNA_ID=CAMNT_0026079289 /DNA_START=95 /DNA_END=650 /DNA_ORIENTATION=+
MTQMRSFLALLVGTAAFVAAMLGYLSTQFTLLVFLGLVFAIRIQKDPFRGTAVARRRRAARRTNKWTAEVFEREETQETKVAFVLGDVGPSFAGNLPRTVPHADEGGASTTCDMRVVESSNRTVFRVQFGSASSERRSCGRRGPRVVFLPVGGCTSTWTRRFRLITLVMRQDASISRGCSRIALR